MKNLSLTTLALAVSAALTITPEARAQDGGYIAAGIGAVPEYEGASDQQVIPFFAGRYESGGRSISLEGLALRADLLSSDVWEAGPVATYTFGRDNESDAIVSRLEEIDGAVEAGAYVARTWATGPDGARDVRVAFQAVQDISDVHEGWILTPSVSVARSLTPRLRVSTELSANIVSDEYAESYFSITPAGAVVTGLTPLDAGGGLKDVGLGFNWSFALNDTWSVTGYSVYRRLLGDAADSPLVDRAGDANQYSAGLGIGMSF